MMVARNSVAAPQTTCIEGVIDTGRKFLSSAMQVREVEQIVINHNRHNPVNAFDAVHIRAEIAYIKATETIEFTN